MQLKTICTAGLALAIAGASMVSTADAQRRHHHGFPFAAGALGFTAGAFFGSPFYGPRYSYYEEPGYYYDEPGYYYEPAPRAYYRSSPGYYGSGPCNLPTGTAKPAWAMC
jgi:hypothetical protein